MSEYQLTALDGKVTVILKVDDSISPEEVVKQIVDTLQSWLKGRRNDNEL